MKKLQFLSGRGMFRFPPPSLLFPFLIACLLTRPIALYSAFEEKIPAARPAGLGGGFVAVPNDANGIFYNPATLGGLPGANFSFSQTTLFNISDLPYMTFAGAIPTRNLGTIGFAYSQFGPSFYKETEMAFSHSIALARKSYIGYNIRSQSLDMKYFGGTGAVGVDLGVYSAILSNMSAGLSIKNITNPTLGSTAEPLPQIYRLGVSFYPAVGVIFLLEMSKDVSVDGLSYHGGAEINLTKNFAFRTGVKTNPASYSMGLGAGIGIFKINYAMVSHPILDTQNIFSVGIRFGPEEDVAPAESPRRRATRSASRARKSKAELYEELKDLKVNPNKATADELRKIPGVGALTAQRIIDYRDSSGGFRSADDLMNVPRMTKRTLEKIRPYLVFDESAPGVSESAQPAKGAETIETTPKEKTPAPRRMSKERVLPKEETEEYPSEPSDEEEKAVPPPAPKTEKSKTDLPVNIPAVSPAATSIPVPVAPSKATTQPPVKKTEPTPPPVAAPSAAEGKSESVFTEDMLDINSASPEELQVVGFTGAQARNIVRYRNKEGNFSSVDDLLKVPGVDARTLDKVRDSIGVR